MLTGPAGIVYKHFEKVTDPRANRGSTHDLHEMIFMALTAAVCGANGRADEFARNLRNKGVAIDGKTLRGSFDKAAGKSAVHTLTAFAVGTHTVLRQLSVDAKLNEIPAVPLLLQLLELEGD